MPTNPLADVAQDAMLRLSQAVKELEVGDRVTYDGRPGTVQGVGCEHCSSVVVKDDKDGRLYMPGSPYKLQRRSMVEDLNVIAEEERKAEDARIAAKLENAYMPIFTPKA